MFPNLAELRLEDGMGVPKWMGKLNAEPYKSWFMTYELLCFKLDVIGGEKIKTVMQSICDHPFLDDVDDYEKLYNDLLINIRQELNKSWWRFWK
jgi:hypothetical protein